MSKSNNILKNIEILITEASKKVINEYCFSADTTTVFAEINYNSSRSVLYTTISFRVYSIYKVIGLGTNVQNIAVQIIKLIETDNRFELIADNGFINIYLHDSTVKNELNRITLDNEDYSKQSNVDVSKDIFPIWYCINKIDTTIKYLWDRTSKEDPLNDMQSRNLSIYLLFIDYKSNISITDLLYFSEQFYEYDRKRIGSQIPYELYNPIRLILKDLLEK